VHIKYVLFAGNSGWENSPPPEGWLKFRKFFDGVV